jgi:hypothetical protein
MIGRDLCTSYVLLFIIFKGQFRDLCASNFVEFAGISFDSVKVRGSGFPIIRIGLVGGVVAGAASI